MSSSQPPLTLDGPVTVRNIQSIHAEVLARIERDKAVSIQLADDFEGDITFVQLVESARSYAVMCGKSLTLQRPAGKPLVEVLRRAGFTDALAPERAQFWFHREVQQ